MPVEACGKVTRNAISQCVAFSGVVRTSSSFVSFLLAGRLPRNMVAHVVAVAAQVRDVGMPSDRADDHLAAGSSKMRCKGGRRDLEA